MGSQRVRYNWTAFTSLHFTSLDLKVTHKDSFEVLGENETLSPVPKRKRIWKTVFISYGVEEGKGSRKRTEIPSRRRDQIEDYRVIEAKVDFPERWRWDGPQCETLRTKTEKRSLHLLMGCHWWPLGEWLLWWWGWKTGKEGRRRSSSGGCRCGRLLSWVSRGLRWTAFRGDRSSPGNKEMSPGKMERPEKMSFWKPRGG